MENTNTNVNKNGSMLNTEVLTTCNDCFHFETGEHDKCLECDSTNIEVVKEDDLG